VIESPHTVTVGGIGARVTLHLRGSRRAEFAAALRTGWSRCLQPDAAAAGTLLTASLLAPGEMPPDDLDAASGTELDVLLARTTQLITHALIEAQSGQLLMFHAGAVSNPRDGRSLVYVAAGGTGKTTLTQTLGDRYGYLTDETVAIDATDRVLAYPKPLSLRRRHGGPKWERSPDDLGLAAAPDAPVAARVLLLDRDDQHRGEPDVRELGLLDGIELLAPQTSALYALPDGLHRLARLRESAGPVLQVRYAEASTLRGLASELIGQPS
jgi:hypothetical protein